MSSKEEMAARLAADLAEAAQAMVVSFQSLGQAPRTLGELSMHLVLLERAADAADHFAVCARRQASFLRSIPLSETR